MTNHEHTTSHTKGVVRLPLTAAQQAELDDAWDALGAPKPSEAAPQTRMSVLLRVDIDPANAKLGVAPNNDVHLNATLADWVTAGGAVNVAGVFHEMFQNDEAARIFGLGLVSAVVDIWQGPEAANELDRSLAEHHRVLGVIEGLAS